MLTGITGTLILLTMGAGDQDERGSVDTLERGYLHYFVNEN